MGQRDRSPEVDGERPVDLVGPVHRQAPGRREPGVGDQDVDLPGRGDESLDLGGIGEIGRDHRGARLLGERGEHVDTPAAEHEIRTLGTQAARDRRPDAACRARQEDPLTGELQPTTPPAGIPRSEPASAAGRLRPARTP